MKMHYFGKAIFSKWFCFLSLTYYILILDPMASSDALESCCQENPNNTFGWITPTGDVLLRTGLQLEIFCTINSNSEKATHFGNLKFQKDGKLLHATYRNATTISMQLRVLYTTKQKSIIKCFLTPNDSKLPTSVAPKISINNSMSGGSDVLINKDQLETVVSNYTFGSEILIGVVRVKIGSGPQEVENFNCMSYNWNYLRCTWDIPLEQCTSNNYTLRYRPQESTPSNDVSCPWLSYKTACSRECTWSAGTNPPYFHDFENLKFTLTASNEFGTVEQSIYFNKFQHIKPDRPGLLCWDESSTKVKCRWELNDPRRGFVSIPINWTCEIVFKSDFDSRTIICEPEKIISHSVFYFYDVTQLRPKTAYSIKVRIKSQDAPAEAKYWSDFSDEDKCSTPPLDGPVFPESDVSLFEIAETSKSFRAVNIFWKPVKHKDLYGNLSKYKIDVYKVGQTGNKIFVQTRLHNVSSEGFTDTFNISHSNHQFVITSEKSSNFSLIMVPDARNEVKACPLYYVTSRDYYNKTITFECIWKPPEEQTHIVGYTLFWYLLQSNIIDWIHLPANITRHQISIHNEHWLHELSKEMNMKTTGLFNLPQFYISVNTEDSSSGLLQMPKVHSVSHVWHSEWFLDKKLKVLKKPLQKVTVRRNNYDGWKFSSNQFQKWMGK